jgi:hypothetical protein
MTEFSVGGARLVAGAAALAPMAFATYFVGRLDRSLRAYLMTVLTQGRQRIAAIGAGLCLTLLLAATVAPAGSLPWLLGVAAVGGFAVRLITVSASNAHVRSAGIGTSDRVTTVLWWLVIGCIGLAVLLEIGAGDGDRWFSLGALLLVVAAVVCLAVIVRRRRARRDGFRGIRS